MNLTEIKERLNNITPGKWRHIAGVHSPASVVDIEDPHGSVNTLTWDDHGGEVFQPADAEFIAHAPEDIAAMIEILEALRGWTPAAAHDIDAVDDTFERAHIEGYNHAIASLQTFLNRRVE